LGKDLEGKRRKKYKGMTPPRKEELKNDMPLKVPGRRGKGSLKERGRDKRRALIHRLILQKRIINPRRHLKKIEKGEEARKAQPSQRINCSAISIVFDDLDSMTDSK